jgi:hypothetical protein
MQDVPMVFMQSPQSDEIREVQATTAILGPLMSQGWHQVPAPATVAQPETAETKEAN